MSFTSFSFKDNIVINDSKWIRWLDSTGTTRANILGVDSDNVYLNAGSENLYINSNTNSYTYINNNNSNNVLIGSKLAIGINTTSNLNANLAIANSGFIGTNVKNGYISVSGSYSDSSADGSLIKLYGNNSGNHGQLHIIAGNHSSGHLNFYTDSNSLKMQIMSSGMVNLSPDGNNVRVSVSDAETIISNVTKITNTTQSTNTNSGSLQVYGGMSIAKSLYVGESIISGNIVYGTISYGNLYANSLNVGLAKTISSTFDAENNVVSPSNITGLLFNSNAIRSFQGSISIEVVKSSGGNSYESINIEGHYTESTGWTLFTSSVGDITGISINITPIGQIRYTSPDILNWASTKIRYVITYISNTNNYEGINITSGTFVANILNINDTSDAILGSENGSFYNPGGGTFDKNLVVKGDINFVGDLYKNGSLFTGSQWSTNVDNSIFYTTGNVGIGTSDPTTTLDILGNLNVSGGITSNSINISNAIVTNITTGTLHASNGITSGSALFEDAFNANFNSNTLGSIITTGGNIGIGTSMPEYKLDISGDLNFTGNLYQNKSLFVVSGSDLSAGGTIGGHLIPSNNITYDLGSSTNKWRDLYLSGTTIHVGDETISVNTSGNFEFSSSKMIIGGETLTITSGSIDFGQEKSNTTFGNTFSVMSNMSLMLREYLNVFSISTNLNTFDGWVSKNDNLHFTGSDFPGMTDNSTYIDNELYIASASSTESIYESYDAYKAFNLNTSDFWHSKSRYNNLTGEYIGTQSIIANGVTYNGEWLQIKYPKEIRLTNFKLKPREYNESSRSPNNFVLLGSIDGYEWTLLHEENNYTSWTTDPSTFNTSSVTQDYSYFRLVINKVGYESESRNAVQISEFEINPTYTSKTYKLRIIGESQNQIYSPNSVTKNIIIRMLDENNTVVQTLYTSPDIVVSSSEYMSFNIDTEFVEITPLPDYKIQIYMDSTNLMAMGGMTANIDMQKEITTVTYPKTNITGNLLATYNSNTLGSLITTGGNVGIGTTAPTQKLDIIGNLKVSGRITAGSINLNSTTGSIILNSPALITNKYSESLYTYGSLVETLTGYNVWEFNNSAPYFNIAAASVDQDYWSTSDNGRFTYMRTSDDVLLSFDLTIQTYPNSPTGNPYMELQLLDASENIIQVLHTESDLVPNMNFNRILGPFSLTLNQGYKIRIYTNSTNTYGITLLFNAVDLKILQNIVIPKTSVLTLKNDYVGIGTTDPLYKLHVDGDIFASGKIVAFSDERLKTDIVSIDNALNKVSSLRGVEYKMLNSNEKSIGVIAQEVEKICPEFVVSKDNYKGVCYGNMVGLLIEAIKELNEKIKDLENNKLNS